MSDCDAAADLDQGDGDQRPDEQHGRGEERAHLGRRQTGKEEPIIIITIIIIISSSRSSSNSSSSSSSMIMIIVTTIVSILLVWWLLLWLKRQRGVRANLGLSHPGVIV